MDKLPHKPLEMSRRARMILYILVALAGCAVTYRAMGRTAGDFVPGDLRDTRLGIVVLEHWNAVFLGAAPWRSPNYFYPAPGALGFSDTYFLFAPFHVLARRVGFDVYSSYQISRIAVSLIAFASMVWLLRRTFGVSPLFSAVGGLAFAFSNMLYDSHVQLQAVAFVPLLAGLAFATVRAPSRRTTRGYGVASLALFGAILLTTFHIGWFFALFVGVCAALHVLSELATRGVAPAVRHLADLAGRYTTEVALFAAVAVLAVVPFVITYLGTYTASGGHPYDPELLPRVLDAINLGPGNLLWSGLLQPLRVLLGADVPGNRALWKGFGPVLLLGFVVVTSSELARLRGAPALELAPERPPWVRRSLVLAIQGVALSWLLVVRVGDQSLWRGVRLLAPAADAIRGVVRLHYVLAVPIVVVAIAGLDALWRQEARPRKRVALAIALLLIGLGTVNVSPKRGFSKAGELAYLGRFVAPPVGCDAFYGVIDAGGPRPVLARNVDAMLVARRLGVPTINGSTRKQPAGWEEKLGSMHAPEYLGAVSRWVERHALGGGICELDLDRGVWRVGLQQARPAPEVTEPSAQRPADDRGPG